MKRYTTGELAKLCGVSVRTVQYYDTRGILTPSQISDGGRRLYTGEDLNRLKIICFLRELELPIDSIKALLQESHPEQSISLLLEKQESLLRREIKEKRQRANRLAEAKKSLNKLAVVTVESIGDIACILENKAQLRKTRILLTVFGLAVNALEAAAWIMGLWLEIWWPLVLGYGVAILMTLAALDWYFRRTAYICPKCHRVFQPKLGQALFAKHTPNTRELTCTRCSYHGFCLETYGKEIPLC